jgi:glycosyltransferase involved in cell wall biosynthesis
MNRVIYNAYSELIREFDEVIIVSAKNSKELFLGVIKLLKSNPCSFDFIIFNSLSSIRKSHNKFWYLFWLLASVFKIRKVMYWHEMPNYLKKFKDNKENKRDMILINRFLLNKKIKHLSVSSESAKSSYFLNATTESTVVYNTIISKPKFSLLYSTFTVATVGSIQYIKGTDIWTDVAISVCNANKDIQFVWCGGALDKQLYYNCVEKIAKNKLSDRIFFIGHFEDAVSIISASHLYFSSSRLDSFPLSILEAMSQGKNCIFYESGGIKEALSGLGTLIQDFDIDRTKNAILSKKMNFDVDTQSVFNQNIYNQFKENFTPEVFVNNLKKALRDDFS